MRAVNASTGSETKFAAVVSAAAGVVVLAGGTAIGALAPESAGTAICSGAPFLSGFVAAFVRNELRVPARFRHSVFSALLAVAFVCVSVVAWAPGGPLYTLIAAPPVAVLAVLGAMMGHSTARGRPSMSPVIALLMCWPLLAAAELSDLRPGPREVLSMIDVERSPEELSPAAIASELSAPPELQFIAGVTAPDPARQLRMQELSAGRTRIEARTTYTPEIYPTRYWSLWSDAIIHHMQMRVLGQIKREAELNASASN